MIIKKIGVIGCGFMGSGITQICAQSGYKVTVYDINEAALRKGLNNIEYFIKHAAEKGKLSVSEGNAILARIKSATNLKELADSDIVIEVVPEDIKLKQKTFKELDKICSEKTILASNTSTIRIAELAKVTKRPDKVIGTHFLSPVPPSKLLEIVRPDTTSDETLEILKRFGKSLGKEVIVAKDTPGFIFNYLLGALSFAALELLENGIATKEDIDKSMTLGLGHPIGPIALMDFNGLDVIYLTQKAFYDQMGDPNKVPSKLIKKLVV
ncbi:MAG: 3-hydroxyacyl-CoA dehydrogenase family protein [Dehalococcoidales bacterium]|nr:3-hydroxyacyl-CoA dehydrogenase family protein [Dehalococcoidales bacterium]